MDINTLNEYVIFCKKIAIVVIALIFSNKKCHSTVFLQNDIVNEQPKSYITQYCN